VRARRLRPQGGGLIPAPGKVQNAYRATWVHTMRKFHSIATLCGDGLRPELQALFDRLAIDPRSELFVRDDGMVQAGPDPASETALKNVVPLRADKPANVTPAVADALAAGWWERGQPAATTRGTGASALRRGGADYDITASRRKR
jgi:hypothetical protein